jgi:hypothetical protein
LVSCRGDCRLELRIDRFWRLGFLDVDLILSTLIDPRAQDADVFRRQCSCGRHLHASIAAHQSPDEFALSAFAWNDDWTIIPATQSQLPIVQSQARLLLLWSMAGVTLLRQDGPNMLLEVHLNLSRRWERGICGEQRKRQQKTNPIGS